ncbi:MAG TPA: nicotinate (nicotinamide) nucleotide adenylyltransferase [Magnetospirillaceae bacterium]|nr:nicotinate (nicotinamide) nucleotide adenylyltransferase [Magnetospirillaceae bacterium]
MRLLMFGGSFNPLHIGHLILAEEARIALSYTHVALVPAFIRPFKDIQADPGPQARFAMAAAAARDDPTLLVWEGEVRRGGESYSIDTVRELARAFRLEDRPGLLLGDDILAGFREWREADALAREASIVCARREHAERLPFPWEHVYLDNLMIPVSSRMVRGRVAAGLPYRRLVPDAVWRIIEEEKYYRGG